MTGLLSAISGQFSRWMLLSTLLPVVVFVLLTLSLVLPAIPASVPLVTWLQGLDSEWKLAAVTLAVVLLSALLHNLNSAIVRFYEGYPWCDSLFGKWRSQAHRRRLASLQGEWRGLGCLLTDAEAERQLSYRAALERWNRVGRILNTEYPERPEDVLPTKLGNVIRSFESYPYRQYGIRSVTVWPRLVAVIGGDHAARVDEARSSLDFMLNASFLCVFLSALITGAHLLFPVGLVSRIFSVAAIIIAFLVFSYWFYLAALSRARTWGTTIKVAFDLYRRDLLAALGYEPPGGQADERNLWERLSSQWIFSDLTTEPAPDCRPVQLATSARATPEGLPLVIARGARRSVGGDSLTVTVRVGNADGSRTATSVTVVEFLPRGWVYEWSSAQLDANTVEVEGTGPYLFRLGDLKSGAEVLLTYRIFPFRAAPDEEGECT